jgi:tetrahydromethanopterin S-methyltransferase subunit F
MNIVEHNGEKYVSNLAYTELQDRFRAQMDRLALCRAAVRTQDAEIDELKHSLAKMTQRHDMVSRMDARHYDSVHSDGIAIGIAIGVVAMCVIAAALAPLFLYICI